jgi:hypothetical protein
LRRSFRQSQPQNAFCQTVNRWGGFVDHCDRANTLTPAPCKPLMASGFASGSRCLTQFRVAVIARGTAKPYRDRLLQAYGGVDESVPPMGEWAPEEIEAHITYQKDLRRPVPEVQGAARRATG